jgi:hypothetical protein
MSPSNKNTFTTLLKTPHIQFPLEVLLCDDENRDHQMETPLTPWIPTYKLLCCQPTLVSSFMSQGEFLFSILRWTLQPCSESIYCLPSYPLSLCHYFEIVYLNVLKVFPSLMRKTSLNISLLPHLCHFIHCLSFPRQGPRTTTLFLVWTLLSYLLLLYPCSLTMV